MWGTAPGQAGHDATAGRKDLETEKQRATVKERESVSQRQRNTYRESTSERDAQRMQRDGGRMEAKRDGSIDR